MKSCFFSEIVTTIISRQHYHGTLARVTCKHVTLFTNKVQFDHLVFIIPIMQYYLIITYINLIGPSFGVFFVACGSYGDQNIPKLDLAISMRNQKHSNINQINC